jgi:hypothetical protein
MHQACRITHSWRSGIQEADTDGICKHAHLIKYSYYVIYNTIKVCVSSLMVDVVGLSDRVRSKSKSLMASHAYTCYIWSNLPAGVSADECNNQCGNVNCAASSTTHESRLSNSTVSLLIWGWMKHCLLKRGEKNACIGACRYSLLLYCTCICI